MRRLTGPFAGAFVPRLLFDLPFAMSRL